MLVLRTLVEPNPQRSSEPRISCSNAFEGRRPAFAVAPQPLVITNEIGS